MTLLPFPGPVGQDLAEVATVARGQDNLLRARVEAHIADTTANITSTVIASRPAFGTVGRLWITTDTAPVQLWYDTGAAWVKVGP